MFAIFQDVVHFMKKHIGLLLFELFVSILLCCIANSVSLHQALNEALGPKNDVIRVALKEAPASMYTYQIPFVTLVCVTGVFYFYVLFLESALFRPIWAYRNYEKYCQKTDSRLGANIFYVALLILICASFSGTNDTPAMRRLQQDVESCISEASPTSVGVLRPITGEFVKNPQGDTKQRPKAGIVYMTFYGNHNESSYCMRISPEMAKAIDQDPHSLYRVTYWENTKIVTDLEPLGLLKGDNLTKKIYGHEHFTDQEEEWMEVIMGESLRDMWLACEDKDFVIPIYFDESMSREQFHQMYQYYLSYYFEYMILPYQYDQYATQSNSLILSDNIQGGYFPNDTQGGNFGLMTWKYYVDYSEKLDSIVSKMPDGLSDFEKVAYLSNVLLDMSSTVNGVTVQELDDFEQTMMCVSGYGPLLAGSGNNNAYTQALYGLLKRADLEVLPIVSESTNYSMLMVKVDSNWYYLDVYQTDKNGETKGTLFTSEHLKEYVYNGNQLKDFHYGYTDEILPAVDASEELTFDVTASLEPKVDTSFEEVKGAVSFDEYNPMYPIDDTNEDAIRKWVEETFVQVVIGKQDTSSSNNFVWEHMDFKRGERCNDYAKELLRYLTIHSCHEYNTRNMNFYASGYAGTGIVLSADEYVDLYSYFTGFSGNDALSEARYKTPDHREEYLYLKSSGLIGKACVYETDETVTLPYYAQVERLEKTDDGYDVVFFVNTSGFGEHYFDLKLVYVGDDLLIDELRSRYE